RSARRAALRLCLTPLCSPSLASRGCPFRCDLHAFPTRRSPDLSGRKAYMIVVAIVLYAAPSFIRLVRSEVLAVSASRYVEAAKRSEEHTSELQSRENLVCRLLLEKKKINSSRSCIAF